MRLVKSTRGEDKKRMGSDSRWENWRGGWSCWYTINDDDDDDDSGKGEWQVLTDASA